MKRDEQKERNLNLKKKKLAALVPVENGARRAGQ